MKQLDLDPTALLVKVAKILEDLKIPYMVTGGMAVIAWGRIRTTADIDIVIELELKNVNNLVAALSAIGKGNYVDKNMIEEALKYKSEFNFIHGETGMKVDFWISSDYFDSSFLKRRIGKDILGQKVYFISPEDLILRKLQWYAQSQSTRHLEDIESVLKVSGKKLDINYLKTWAKKLDQSDTLLKAALDRWCSVC